MDRLLVYSHLDEPLFELDPTQVIASSMVEKVNGEHSLTIQTTQELEKGQRIFHYDGEKVREFVVLGDTQTRLEGLPNHTYYCVWSLQYDLSAAYIDDRRLGNADNQKPASDALGLVTSTNRWEVGYTDVETLSSGWFYYMSCWDALSKTVENWVGEVDSSITMNPITRRLDFKVGLGSPDATHRFEYAHDMTSVKRTVLDDLYVCRVVPRGKGEQVSDDPEAYGRRINIKDVNPTGEEWIQDDDAAALVRVPNGDGYDYPTQIVIYDSIEDPQELYDRAMSDLETYTRPKVSYEADVVDIGGNVSLGDEVQVIDKALGLRLTARVLGIETNLLDKTKGKVTIGNFRYSMSDTIKGLEKGLEAAQEQLIDTDGKADAALEDADAASAAAIEAQRVANAVNQHFWVDTDGAHVTEVTQDEWNNPMGQTYHAGFNSLWNSLGMLFRNALRNLVGITSSAISFFDGAGNGSNNIVAMLGIDGARIGRESAAHTTITDTETAFHDADGNVAGKISMSSEGTVPVSAVISLTTTSSNPISDSITGIEPLPDFTLGNMVLRVSVDGAVVRVQNISSLSEPKLSFSYDDIRIEFQTTQDGDTWGADVYAKNYVIDAGETTRDILFALEWYVLGTAPMYTFGTAENTGAYSFSAGIGLKAAGNSQAVFGRYNKPSQTDLLIVGNGTSDLNRSNALKVNSQGVLETSGYFQDGGVVGLGSDAQESWLSTLGFTFGVERVTSTVSGSTTITGTWKWTRFPNGLVIAKYGDDTNRTFGVTTQQGSLYWGQVNNIPFPFTFSYPPAVAMSESSTSNYYAQISQVTTSGTGPMFIARGTSNTFGGKLNLIAVGTAE